MPSSDRKMPTAVDLYGGGYLEKIEKHILKFQKILKKIIHVNMDALYVCATFEDEIHYDESYTKKTNRGFQTDEQCKHCSLLEMHVFLFFV